MVVLENDYLARIKDPDGNPDSTQDVRERVWQANVAGFIKFC